jgi:hypothetical protein
MPKNWSHIGEVTLRHRDGRRWKYPSLKAAIQDNTRGWQKWGDRAEVYVFCTVDGVVTKTRIESGDTYTVVDEIGMIIPVWRIAEEGSKLGLSRNRICIRWYRRPYAAGYRSERHFRRGPVPGTRRWSFRKGHGPRTTQEIRENEALDYDEDALNYGIRVRDGRRYPNIPDSWDEYEGRRENGWKAHRRTQWRERK